MPEFLLYFHPTTTTPKTLLLLVLSAPTQLAQVQNDYKEKLEKEVSAREQLEKEAMDLKEKLEKCEAEIESSRKTNELNLLPLSSFSTETWMESFDTNNISEDNRLLVPKIPAGVSGTALAASLLRDGWSLAKIYAKYQEAVDALRHEQLGRKESEAVLQRKLLLELKNSEGWEGFGDKRGIHLVNWEVVSRSKEKGGLGIGNLPIHMIWKAKVPSSVQIFAWSLALGKLNLWNRLFQAAKIPSAMPASRMSMLSEFIHAFRMGEKARVLWKCSVISTFWADLRRRERDYYLAQKEISDLQKQFDSQYTFVKVCLSTFTVIAFSGVSTFFFGEVTVLLKECRDIQLRCGLSRIEFDDDAVAIADVELAPESDAEKIISEHLLTFKDINGLVEQNVQLRSLVRNLSDQIESREMEFKDKLELELKKHTDEAASKVAAVLDRAEEQGRMIESLHTSVAMYKRLYEEEHKLHSSHTQYIEAAPDGRKDLLLLLEGSQEATKRAQEKMAERVRCLEDDLGKARSEIIALRSERDKLALEAEFAREKLDSVMREAEHQKVEVNGVLARNVEFSQLVVDYQRKLRETSESLNAAQELSRKLAMEVSVLKHEKEMLSNAEQRAYDEVRSLSQRVYRLQASLDTIQNAEEVREEARAAERRKQEEYIKQVEREWAEAKKELQEERDNVRLLTSDREQTLKNAVKQVEEMGKELATALRAVASAETRAAVAETKLSDMEKRIRPLDTKGDEVDDGSRPSDEVQLQVGKEELEKLKEEAQANREHMLQYKSIAQVNEAALKEMETVHENFRTRVEGVKKSLEDELHSLRKRVSELERENILKSEEIASAAGVREDALASAREEITSLKEERSIKISQIVNLEVQVSALKEDLEKEHERRQAAQANYERQVILQSETIQELTKTSQALASLQEQASELRKLADALKAENSELKSKWELEKSVLEKLKNEAEEKYDEVNEQNKILHSRLEALHIQLTEKDGSSVRISSQSTDSNPIGDASLQSVISFLRNRKSIAETEVALLTTEKLRLQKQLESALKAAENAQASLTTERANSRAMLLTEEEIKSLKLQVRELNLLRESNVQLREENKYNFEECQVAQKTKSDCDNLENLLRERQIEIEACNKEIEKQRMEKENLEKRVSEEKLSGKNAEIEETRNLLSTKLDTISQLEQELANSRLELSEKEKRLSDISQAEAARKLEMEKQKRISAQLRRKCEMLSKEKEESIKENQSLARQLDDLKQGKKSTGDVTGEQVMKEKEEKDTRIQILERTVERQREELKKEKDDNQKEKEKRLKGEKVMLDSAKLADQWKTRISSELEQHKQTVKRLSDELEKLKHTEAGLPEGTSVVQLLSGTNLDDHASSYFSAVESFERVARSVIVELGTCGPSETSLALDAAAAAATTGSAVATVAPVTASSAGPGTSHLPVKATDGKERVNLPKTNAETRKPGRRLVRPRLKRPEESQGDMETSEAEGSNITGKVAASHDAETQGNLALQSQPSARKRPASTTTELREESLSQGEPSSDVPAPVLKKSKLPDSSSEDAGGQSASPLEDTQPTTEESVEAVGDLAQGSNEEAVEAEKEQVDNTGEKAEEMKESHQVDTTSEAELQNDKNDVLEENLDRPTGVEMACDDGSKDQAEQENQQLTLESESEREEGELLPDVTEVEGAADLSNVVGSPEIGELLPELVSTPVVSPGGNEDEAPALEEPQEAVNDEGDGTEENAEGLDKSNDGEEADQVPEGSVTTGETASTSSAIEPDISRQPSSSATTTEAKQASPPASNASHIVNLRERARERAMQRQAGAMPSTVIRGRGRPAGRGRGVRGGRSGRGQSPAQQ
ncbi:hypothetical protein CUMW_067490 [Citrus unshiu]|nr:hypothetical protein CUMW_067490 [Citrus unshiu]